MAIGDVAGRDAVDLEPHHFRLLGLRPEGADDRLQRTHPAQAPGSAEAAPQRIDFGQGKLSDDRGQDLGQHLRRRAAGPLDHAT